MQDLQNLVELVSSPHINPIKIFTESQPSGAKLLALFNGIKEGKFQTDADASQSIYGGPPSEKRYMVLRKKLLDTIADSLAAYDYSKVFSKATTERLQAYRTVISITVLLASFKRDTANLIASRLLTEAEKYSLTDIRLFCLKTLRSSGSLQGNSDMFNRYNEELKKVIQLHNEELYSEETYQAIELNYINSFAGNKTILELAEQYLNRDDVPRSAITSFTLEINRYRILFLYLILSRDYGRIFEVFAETQELFAQYPHLANSARKAEFMVIVMNASIRVEDYTQALYFARQCQALYPSGGSNWFAVQARIIQILLCLDTHGEAAADFIEAVNMPNFQRLPQFQQDHWVILGGYLNLLVGPGKLDIASIKNEKFRNAIGRIGFANVTQSGSKDKIGMNIAIQILQLLSFLSRREPELAVTRINLLRRYMKKYKCEEIYARTKVFIDTILVILRPGLPNKKQGYQAGLIANIRDTPGRQLLDDIEIIPYELLWRRLEDELAEMANMMGSAI